MNKEIWKDNEEFQECLDNYATIIWKKTLKRYKGKFWDITLSKWASIVAYYKRIFTNKFITVEEYLKEKKDTKSVKARKKNKRSKVKSDSIDKYKKYIKSKERQDKRVKYFIKYRFTCQICKWEFTDKQLSLHHHTYERVWKERSSDFAVVCIKCHQNIHFKNGKKIRLNEKDLRARFAELII